MSNKPHPHGHTGGQGVGLSPPSAHDLSRRQCLGWGGALGAGLLGLPLASSLWPRPAGAAGDDYMALVCLSLNGGNDGLNMLPPRDAGRHALYQTVRGALALPRSSLQPLDADHGLHPAMAALAGVWADGALAPVFNVGPLAAPLSKAQYRAAVAGDGKVPDSLFSHPDQQRQWDSAATRSAERSGWGGRAATAMAGGAPPIAIGGNAQFVLSDQSAAWVLPGPGADFGVLGLHGADPATQARGAALQALLRDSQTSPLAEAYARAAREAMVLESRLATLVSAPPDPAFDTSGIAQAFAAQIGQAGFVDSLAGQLCQVARLVHGRATVGSSRQIFHVQLNGFDHHAMQVGDSALLGVHAALLQTLAQAMASFWQALQAIGMADRVTLFTQSDFGRTFAPNDSRGTDHGWGNHQLVMGGAVLGGRCHGRYPTLALGGPDDVAVETWERQGRWIPSASVDQYAATLLRWWGLGEAGLDTVLPQLRHFGSERTLGFMRG